MQWTVHRLEIKTDTESLLCRRLAHIPSMFCLALKALGTEVLPSQSMFRCGAVPFIKFMQPLPVCFLTLHEHYPIQLPNSLPATKLSKDTNNSKDYNNNNNNNNNNTNTLLFQRRSLTYSICLQWYLQNEMSNQQMRCFTHLVSLQM